MITIVIETGNAAFTDNEGGEVARILRKLADRWADDSQIETEDVRLMDYNGNGVGKAVRDES